MKFLILVFYLTPTWDSFTAHINMLSKNECLNTGIIIELKKICEEPLDILNVPVSKLKLIVENTDVMCKLRREK